MIRAFQVGLVGIAILMIVSGAFAGNDMMDLEKTFQNMFHSQEQIYQNQSILRADILALDARVKKLEGK